MRILVFPLQQEIEDTGENELESERDEKEKEHPLCLRRVKAEREKGGHDQARRAQIDENGGERRQMVGAQDAGLCQKEAGRDVDEKDDHIDQRCEEQRGVEHPGSPFPYERYLQYSTADG